jgi:hypothetical protein
VAAEEEEEPAAAAAAAQHDPFADFGAFTGTGTSGGGGGGQFAVYPACYAVPSPHYWTQFQMSLNPPPVDLAPPPPAGAKSTGGGFSDIWN